MISPELTPLQQAHQELPKRWYENYDPSDKRVQFIGNSALVLSTLAYAALMITGNDNINYHLIGAGGYLLSAIADNASTVICLNSIKKAETVDINSEHAESYPGLQEVKSGRDFLFNPRLVILDVFRLAYSTIYPTTSLVFSVPKLVASLNNLRIAKRYDRAIEIATANLGSN